MPVSRSEMRRARKAFRRGTDNDGSSSSIGARRQVAWVIGGAILGSIFGGVLGMALSIALSAASYNAYVPLGMVVGAVLGAVLNTTVYRQLPDWLDY